MSKLRIAHLVIQPALVVDDGEELTPGPHLEAATVTISQLQDYVTKLKEFVAGQNSQAESAVQE
jgi:hypothetical protein